MKVLDFTKETDELENKLIKLGFRVNHYSRIPAIHRQPCHPDHGAPCGRPAAVGATG